MACYQQAIAWTKGDKLDTICHHWVTITWMKMFQNVLIQTWILIKYFCPLVAIVPSCIKMPLAFRSLKAVDIEYELKQFIPWCAVIYTPHLEMNFVLHLIKVITKFLKFWGFRNSIAAMLNFTKHQDDTTWAFLISHANILFVQKILDWQQGKLHITGQMWEVDFPPVDLPLKRPVIWKVFPCLEIIKNIIFNQLQPAHSHSPSKLTG